MPVTGTPYGEGRELFYATVTNLAPLSVRVDKSTIDVVVNFVATDVELNIDDRVVITSVDNRVTIVQVINTPYTYMSGGAPENFVENGDFSVVQRWQAVSDFSASVGGAIGTATTYPYAITADRWTFYRNAWASQGTWYRLPRPTSGTNPWFYPAATMARIHRDAGTTNTSLTNWAQTFDHQAMMKMWGKRMCVSIYALGRPNGSYSNIGVQFVAGSDFNRNPLWTGFTSSATPLNTSRPIPKDNKWYRHWWVFDMPSGYYSGWLRFYIDHSASASAADDAIDFGAAQLEEGNRPSKWVQEPYSETFAKCSRFMTRWGGASAFEAVGMGLSANSTTLSYIQVKPPYPLRAVPTLLWSGLRVFGANGVQQAVTSITNTTSAAGNRNNMLTFDVGHASLTSTQQAVWMSANNTLSMWFECYSEPT